MKKFLSEFFAPALALLFFYGLSGCSSTADTSVSQSVYEIAWLPDESGMLAYIDKVTISSLDGSSVEGQNLYHVGADGSIGNSINAVDAPADPSGSGYAPIVAVSSDGHTAISSFTNGGTGHPDIYRYDLVGGGVTDILQGAYLLGVSPDLAYAATTSLSPGLPYYLLGLFDLNTLQPVLPKETIPGAASNRVLWIDGTHYAITIQDSVAPDNTPRFHVAIYNTSGTITQVIPNADVAFHVSAYAPKSGDLFVQNYMQGIDKFNLSSQMRTSVIANDSVYSMDVSSDGTLVVYISKAAAQNLTAYAVNVANGHRSNSIFTSVAVAKISPNADRVAFIHQISGGSNSDIQVVSVQPPS